VSASWNRRGGGGGDPEQGAEFEDYRDPHRRAASGRALADRIVARRRENQNRVIGSSVDPAPGADDPHGDRAVRNQTYRRDWNDDNE
jgi:hypothetical protein